MMNVSWKDSEKTILIRELSEAWTWEDYEADVQMMHQMLGEVKHDTYVIIDACQIETIPKGSLYYFNAANRNIPSNVRMRILVSKNSLIHTLFSILQRTIPENFLNYACVSTLEEAHRRIAKAKSEK